MIHFNNKALSDTKLERGWSPELKNSKSYFYLQLNW